MSPARPDQTSNSERYSAHSGTFSFSLRARTSRSRRYGTRSGTFGA
jgi:hypothetical protein